MPCVCAVHAVMLGGISPLSRYAWSRRTKEAPGRHIEGASAGSMGRVSIQGTIEPCEDGGWVYRMIASYLSGTFSAGTRREYGCNCEIPTATPGASAVPLL
jgi:hypothetical protein